MTPNATEAKQPLILYLYDTYLFMSVLRLLLTYLWLVLQGSVAALDPTDREEAIMEGRISFSLNVHK